MKRQHWRASSATIVPRSLPALAFHTCESLVTESVSQRRPTKRVFSCSRFCAQRAQFICTKAQSLRLRHHRTKKSRHAFTAHLARIGKFTAIGLIRHTPVCTQHRHRGNAFLDHIAVSGGDINIAIKLADINFHHHQTLIRSAIPPRRRAIAIPRGRSESAFGSIRTATRSNRRRGSAFSPTRGCAAS